MHYTSASYLTGDETLEEAQIQKCASSTTTRRSRRTSWCSTSAAAGARTSHYLRSSAASSAAHGITLSTAQAEWTPLARSLPGVRPSCATTRTTSPKEKYDALQSIEMIDHLVLAAQANEGKAVDIYREYFRKRGWVKPGGCFGFQAILRNRVPRTEGPRGPAFTADVIFPGGLNPRLEELVMAAVNPYWESSSCARSARATASTTGRVAAPPASPPREGHPREVGRPGLRRLRPLPRAPACARSRTTGRATCR
jgi:cyclopropane-fatty-acyl-phospholipid synthase